MKPDGTPSIAGAFSMSSPIAYSLSDKHMAIGLSNTSFTHDFKFPSGNQKGSNGTAWAMLGFSKENWGALTVGGTIISIPHHFPGRNTLSAEYTPPIHLKAISFGLGMQDITGNAGSSGEGIENIVGRGHSNSAFAVATADLGGGAFLSAGTGSQRFRHSFVNGSYLVHERYKLFAEHDGFNFNYGVAAELGPYLGGESEDSGHANVTMMIGLVRSRYPTWSVNVTF